MIIQAPLNSQVLALEEAEAKIREIVKREFFRRTQEQKIRAMVEREIAAALKAVRIPALRLAAEQSLRDFYRRQSGELRRSFAGQFTLLAAALLLAGRSVTGDEIKPTEMQKARAVQTFQNSLFAASRLSGVPIQRYSEEYIKKYVRPAFERLAEQQPRDPGDISGRNTLRNRAEMEVRYDDHQQNIADLKASGVKLVIASSHADCSERCAPWQGRVYSLDGTSGVTDDGRSYVPLEDATDVYYKTGAGKIYKNGLLGFNCRHFLVPYKSGYRFPKPNEEEERRQYAITKEQRRLETNVRRWRTIAVENKDVDRERYLEARRNAIAANREYITFSKLNGRAYYPSRTALL